MHVNSQQCKVLITIKFKKRFNSRAPGKEKQHTQNYNHARTRLASKIIYSATQMIITYYMTMLLYNND